MGARRVLEGGKKHSDVVSESASLSTANEAFIVEDEGDGDDGNDDKSEGAPCGKTTNI
jgi:hypothetical protein